MSPTRPRTGASSAKLNPSKTATGGGGSNGGSKPQPPQKDRRVPLLILVILLLLLAFWLGRCSTPPAPAPALPAAPVIAPAASTAPAVRTAPAPATAHAAAPASAPSPTSVTITAEAPRRPKTTLLEVSVGTSGRGGIALLFDHQVTWTVSNQPDGGHAEVDVAGVEALGSFPRNLPLPPGVAAIHAGLKADALSLKFDLKPGILSYTSPADGPATALNVYFRTPIEEASAGAGMQGGAGAAPSPAPTGCGADTSKVVGLLQQSLAKNPGYAEVREALAVLMTCAGNSAMAEQLMADGLKAGGGNTVHTVVLDAALLYARGDAAGAVQMLKAHAPIKVLDHGYFELLADFQNAAK